MLVLRFVFFDFLGLNLDVWVSRSKHLARDSWQKPTFAEVWILMISGSVFDAFLAALVLMFTTLEALEMDLEFDNFPRVSW